MSTPAPRTMAIFFEQLSRQLGAGLPLAASMGHMRSQTSNAGLVALLDDAAVATGKGESLGDTFARHPHLFPAHELAFLRAAEATGGLPDACGKLASAYQARHTRLIAVGSSMIYPLGLLLVASLLLPLKLLIGGHVLAYLFTAIPSLVMVLGSLAGLAWLTLATSARELRQTAFRTGLGLPVIGKFLGMLTLARMGEILALGATAGLPPGESYRLLAGGVLDPRVAKAAGSVAQAIAHGRTQAESLAEHPKAFPSVLRQVVLSGEESGTLDHVLTKHAELWTEDANRALDTAVKVGTTIITMMVLLTLARSVIVEGMSYIHQIDHIEDL